VNDPFEERVERLKQELELALTWDRPSILLAVYASEFVRADAEALLEAWLRKRGLSVARIRITDPGDAVADVPQTLRAWPSREETVFFIAGLAQGAPTTWKALNVRREYLVEDRVRAVFWLTEKEAADLPRRAPDFWAFRHWVVEFMEMPEAEHAAERAGELAWRGFKERLPAEERGARIALRERLLAELPETRETAAARADLHYTLGGLYTWDRKQGEALEHFRAAHELAERLEDTQRQVWSLNGLGIVYADLGRHEEAIAAYRRAIDLDPEYASPHNNLGDTYLQLGRLEEARAESQERVHLSPDDALSAQVSLGIIARHRGDDEQATRHFRRAVATWDRAQQRKLQSPFALLENKALALLGLGRPDEAVATLREALAQRLPGDSIDFYCYDLLAESPDPPAGLDEMVALLQEADGEKA
jgi:tetratricopeptide (TPR) repeat protein